MKRGFAYFLSILGSFLLLFVLMFTCLKVSMNDEKWFLNEYTRLGTAKDIGMSNSDINASINSMIDYMEGRKDSIQVSVTFEGNQVEMFNEREIAHMVDVRNLYQGVQTTAIIALILCAIMLILAAGMMRRDALPVLSRGYLIGMGIFVIAVAALGIWVLLDFTSFWTAFHHMFFTNDLWLLDPRIDRMILICPEQLFFDIVVRFGGRFLAIALVLCAAAILCLAIRRKKHTTSLARRSRRGGHDGV